MHRRENMETWLREIGELIKRRMTSVLNIEEKTSLADVVTNVDKEVECLFHEKIARDYPMDHVIGEESYDEQKKYDLTGNLWVIDPIDGTLNFVKEQRNFAVMVAYYVDGVGQLGFIYDVMSNELYVAQRGKGVFKNGQALSINHQLGLQESVLSVSANIFFKDPVPFAEKIPQALSLRILGSAGMSFVRLINGSHQGYVCVKLKAWDYMAGLIFAHELGLVVTTFKGDPIPLLKPTTLLCATPKVHDMLLN